MDDIYPTYCSGWLILYTRDVIGKLYETSQRMPYFWIDDVFVTGQAAKKVNARHFTIESLNLPSATAKQMMANGTNHSGSGRYVIGPHGLKPEEILKLWELKKK
jgi:hypothetical protein